MFRDAKAVICENGYIVPLGKEHFAIIDKEDYQKYGHFNWSYSKGYGILKKDNKVYILHRLIIGAKNGQEVDHINRCKADCRKSNLRFCTRSQNSANTQRRRINAKSKYKGVSYDSKSGKWRVAMSINGKRYTGPRMELEIEAAELYDSLAKQHQGEFAVLNFP